MRSFWSESEIEILKKNYPLSTKKELMLLLPGRSSVSIGHKANRLGLKNESRPWTEIELNILRENYPVVSKKEILRLLPKKRWTSIRHKAFELGLKYKLNKFYKKNWKSFSKIELTDIEKGYLAGVIDSDGSITIKLTNDKRMGKTYYAPLISIYNTDVRMMNRIIEIVKHGSIYNDESSKSKNRNYKTKYIYNIASIRAVKQLLEQVVPYLMVKKERGELILELIDIKENSKNAEPTPRVMEIFHEVRRLNRLSNRNIKS